MADPFLDLRHSFNASSLVKGTGKHSGAPNKRFRLFEMGSWCCSIVGTCLSHEDLMVLARKWNISVGEQAREFDIHGFFVRKAGKDCKLSRAIEKTLERRYSGMVRRVARIGTEEQLVNFWKDAVSDGRVAGAYWALISHRHVSEDLRNRVFGEIHMMSHLMGGTARRYVGAAAELQQKLDHALAQKERLSVHARKALSRRDAQIEEQERQLIEAKSKQSDQVVAMVPTSCKLSELLHKRERALLGARTKTRQLEAELSAARVQIEKLKSLRKVSSTMTLAVPVEDNSVTLCGRAILYLGGRSQSVVQLRKVAEQCQFNLLHHDGGMEQSSHLINDLVQRCDAVVCPVNCISHGACLKAKKLCKSLDKPFMPVNSAGKGGFTNALNQLALRLAKKDADQGNYGEVTS